MSLDSCSDRLRCSKVRSADEVLVTHPCDELQLSYNMSMFNVMEGSGNPKTTIDILPAVQREPTV